MKNIKPHRRRGQAQQTNQKKALETKNGGNGNCIYNTERKKKTKKKKERKWRQKKENGTQTAQADTEN